MCLVSMHHVVAACTSLGLHGMASLHCAPCCSAKSPTSSLSQRHPSCSTLHTTLLGLSTYRRSSNSSSSSSSSLRATLSAGVSEGSGHSHTTRRRSRKATGCPPEKAPPQPPPLPSLQPTQPQQPLNQGAANGLSGTSSSTTSTSSSSAAAAGLRLSRRKRARLAKLQQDAPLLVEALVSRTQLPRPTAEKVVGARGGTAFVTSDPDKLCSRVLHLQQLLGRDNAELALRRSPHLVAYSPASLAYNCRQWQLFFGSEQPPPGPAGPSPLRAQLEAARQEALLLKLARRPELLTSQVEQQVANLYEAGAMLGHQDIHCFAYKALAGMTGPDALQDKLLMVLDTLNADPHPQQQQQQQQLLGLDQLQQAPQAGDQAAPAAEVFSLADLQAAARRDPKWLQLSVGTLEQRLHGMQQELGLSMAQVGRMVLRNPSLLNKRPATLAAKAAALRALPGLRPEQAAAAIASLPSLLNLDSQKLRDRWQRLQQAADSHPAWRAGLDAASASSLAGMLVRGEGHYQRLQRVIDLGLQEHLSMVSLLSSPDSAFEGRLAKAAAKAAAAARAAAAPAKPRAARQPTSATGVKQ